MAEGRPPAAVWIATCAGVGFFPKAPGTAGSLVGVLLVAVLGELPFGRIWASAVVAAAVLGIYALGVWASGEAEKFFAVTDPRQVVIDEVAGQMLAYLVRPRLGWPCLVAGFLLFRALDVLKPFPARRLEKLRGGWGVMTDDVVAGIYSLCVLTLLESLIK